MARNTKIIATPIPIKTTKRAAREEHMSTQCLRATSSRGGIAAVRATRFVGSLGEMTLPQSKVAYLNDPKAIVPARLRKLRPPSPTRTVAARTTLRIASVWQNQTVSAVPGLGPGPAASGLTASAHSSV